MYTEEPTLGKTLGEQRVRTTFNPSSEDIVSHIKDKTAALINMVAMIKYEDEKGTQKAGERARLVALALTAYEEAAMWGVKAATLK